MKLFSILNNLKYRAIGNLNVEISGLCHNDKEVIKGDLFFCINGTSVDGKLFAQKAKDNGAIAIVVENEIEGLKICQIIVSCVRSAMSKIACNFYGNPADKLKIIGVTGTNGKTTTTHMFANALKLMNINCAVIGTNGIKFNGKCIDTGMTTPDPIILQKYLAIMVKEKIKYVCMEVSAHAIFLKKLDGFVFDLMIFSNLTEDHLDFFNNMENYFMTKKQIFLNHRTKKAVINIDDEYGKRLYQCIKTTKYSYAMNSLADYVADNIKIEKNIQSFNVLDTKISSNFLGKFNVYNLLSVVAGLNVLGFKIRDISKIAPNLTQVDGRFNTFIIKEKLFVIDYAHTPDGLENVLNLCLDLKKSGKIFCVFGCGGNRDKNKRKIMGELASKKADFVIITTDNPRFEKRADIAKDIELGIIGKNYGIILDRSEAIRYADSISKKGDIILIAGKGAENYIDENGIKTYYSDYEEIEKIRG